MADQENEEREEARATLRYLKAAPQKVRLVVDLVRGKPVTEALAILRFSNKVVAKDLGKLLRSAVANAEQTEVGEMEDLFVSRAFVDGGPSLKRIRPAPMGRAFRYLHRTCHVTFHVQRVEGRARPARHVRAPRARKSAKA